MSLDIAIRLLDKEDTLKAFKEKDYIELDTKRTFNTDIKKICKKFEEYESHDCYALLVTKDVNRFINYLDRMCYNKVKQIKYFKKQVKYRKKTWFYFENNSMYYSDIVYVKNNIKFIREIIDEIKRIRPLAICIDLS